MTLQSDGGAAASDPALSAAINAMAPWFHNLHLPDGTETAPDHPLGDFPAFKWEQIRPAIDADLSGARALDIGCNAGFYSFALAERGAEVLALDIDEHYLRQARWAAERLDPHGRVTFRRGTVYDLARIEESFDVILFLGVLYHLRHPLLALDLVAARCRGRLVLQTMTMPDPLGVEPDPRGVPEDLTLEDRHALTRPGWPRAAFIEHRLAGDPTNWWAPDDACVRGMVRSAGMEILANPAHEVFVCAPAGPGIEGEQQRAEELSAIFAPRDAQIGLPARK